MFGPTGRPFINIRRAFFLTDTEKVHLKAYDEFTFEIYYSMLLWLGNLDEKLLVAD